MTFLTGSGSFCTPMTSLGGPVTPPQTSTSADLSLIQLDFIYYTGVSETVQMRMWLWPGGGQGPAKWGAYPLS